MQEEAKSTDFEHFFKDMYPKMMRYAISLLGDGTAAHDVVADMFEKAWQQHCDGLDKSEKHLANWAYATVSNACINHLKHRHVEHANRRELAAAIAYSQTRDYRHHERLLQTVENTVDDMGEPTRTILRLCALKQLTYQQAADIMGISVNTVKKHISKAYGILRDKLNADDEN